MSEKIEISDLPVTDEFLPERRLVQDRGELALIVDGGRIQHLAYFSLIPGPYFRGGHYHLKKVEYFYIVGGRARLLTVDVDSGARREYLLVTGNKVKVLPGLAHRFVAEEETQVIEYYDDVYDKADDVAFTDF